VRFHISFTYQPVEREKLLNFLHGGGLESGKDLKLIGCWIAVQTGTGFAIVDAKSSKAIYEHCSRWSEYGQITVIPVIDASEL
jgi:hypothetical protein